jgi:hypothetical protein
MAPKGPVKNVKLRPLCVKSLRARASLLLRWWAQAERFGKPPRKLWNLICPKAECTDAYGDQKTRQKPKIKSIVYKIFVCSYEPACVVAGTGQNV